ncbi:uncharacterized protein BYT42DRAFT_548881 [Radiomyces spectabilis]|uniref:uncharacterized protein n=1 Tax=Radiomyces spectabilis TaxID=64574 RepID=UPI002220E481|nr:uncharacterized protein BYT42DRAFT_548881 [Radiomyces spectabilis]KAI8370654.1 hypothetical protein BYT42DRAFT_548881 [Radiomyces spectabilis]
MTLTTSVPRAAVPYFEALHDQQVLDQEIANIVTKHGFKQSTVEKMDQVEMTKEDMESAFFVKVLKDVGNLTLTQNGAITNKSTEDACLDLYAQLGAADTDVPRRLNLLKKAWKQDPLTTMKIIINARSIHKGKGSKFAFYVAYRWLLQHHPQTALRNLSVLTDGTIVESHYSKKKKQAETEDDWQLVSEAPETPSKLMKSHGYWKDLANLVLLYSSSSDSNSHPTQSETYQLNKRSKPRMLSAQDKETDPAIIARKAYRAKRQAHRKLCKTLPEEERIRVQAEWNEQVKQRDIEARRLAKAATKDKVRASKCRTIQLLETDRIYRALHLSVARIFASALQRDLDQLKKNQQQQGAAQDRYALMEGLSMAAKWAPSPFGSHDKYTLLSTSIAECLFPPKTHQREGESRSDYLKRIRHEYRKQYTTPLRRALDVTEVRMSANLWDTIDFSHVPSICMNKHAKEFFLHSPDAFLGYIRAVTSGSRSVAASTLMPHELVKKVINPDDSGFKLNGEARKLYTQMQNDLVNAQWVSLRQSIQEAVSSSENNANATMGSSLAVCDVSGSMGCVYSSDVVPLHAAIGLSLMMTALSPPPFNGTLVTFSEAPMVFNVDPSSPFSDQVQDLLSKPAGFSTNLEAVFLDLLLPLAQKHKLTQEQMIKRLFIFSDMHFNAGQCGQPFETLYYMLERKYAEAGYQLPEIVWWDLSGNGVSKAGKDKPLPVTKVTKGCSMMCGFSSASLKLFLSGDLSTEETPEEEETADDKMETDASQEGNTTRRKKEEEQDNRKTPLDWMYEDLRHESYNSVVVVD